MNDTKRLELISEAVLYCQRVRDLGMPVSAYSKALREPIHFLWERRFGSKEKCATYRSKAAIGISLKNRQLIYDHSIPFRYLQKALLAIESPSLLQIETVLEKYGCTALITINEDFQLKASGFNHRMPHDWDGIDPLARYRSVRIELLKNELFMRHVE
ncbi:hypothetical protein [Saccharospirillum mangrovi]|uniref:hypothetical protein n=1 Tax=Saccharospirillum mangrovi TaxID=2161747 RepID=UPI001300B641|nr:hypothetical protein [Saccharospirillum mangrovi]